MKVARPAVRELPTEDSVETPAARARQRPLEGSVRPLVHGRDNSCEDCAMSLPADRLAIRLARDERRLVDVADVYYLEAEAGSTLVRLRSARTLRGTEGGVRGTEGTDRGNRGGHTEGTQRGSGLTMAIPGPVLPEQPALGDSHQFPESRISIL